MERTDILALMGELKLYGMRAALPPLTRRFSTTLQ